jgi:hypothetical protein
MTKNRTTVGRFFLAAAIGLASLGLAGAASANPAVTTSASVRTGIRVDARFAVNVRDHRTPRTIRRGEPYPTPGEITYRRALVRYDLNHNRTIDAAERRAFWVYMAGTGAYGNLASDEVGRFGQLAYLFDSNRDGRLIGVEWRGMDKLIDSLRLFKTLDRNGDRALSAYEVGFSALAPRFRLIDANRDRVLSQQEVRDEVLRAYRNGEC